MRMGQLKLREQAYDAFTQHLLDRRLLPGQFVTQRELADKTAMSLSAIREMIPRLEAEGLIRAISQRGLQIVHIDLQMVVDAFQLREMIETNAVASFVRNASESEIGEHCGRLQGLMEEASSGRITPDLLDRAQRADWAMHDAFVAKLGNRILANVHRVNSIRIRMILQERIGISSERMPIALQQHKEILDAVARRDTDGALKAMRAHLASSRDRALSFDSFDDASTTESAGIGSKGGLSRG
jgi:DNA-binding GntR family transcriptional regulator